MMPWTIEANPHPRNPGEVQYVWIGRNGVRRLATAIERQVWEHVQLLERELEQARRDRDSAVAAVQALQGSRGRKTIPQQAPAG